MPGKEEMLEELTVEELKLMAKAKGITGYSNKLKSELIELVASEYERDEIREWKEIEEPEDEGEEATEKPPSIVEKIESNLVVIGIAICVVAVILGVTAGYYYMGSESGNGSGNGEYSTYVNENLDFTFTGSSNWYVRESPYQENTLFVVDNKGTETSLISSIQVTAKENFLNEFDGLEDYRNYIQGQVDNSENASFIEEPSLIKDGRAVYTQIKLSSSNQKVHQTHLLLMDELMYRAVFQVPENLFDNYREDHDEFFDSFDTIE